MIVLDVNVLPYLQSLGSLESLKDVLRLVGGGHVPWQVYMQVKRSGSLGDRLDEWIAAKLICLHNFRTTDPAGRVASEILRSKDAGLVRKDIADVHCVALARILSDELVSALVCTCERGLGELCKRRRVGSVDLFDILSLLFCEGLVDMASVDVKLRPWQRPDAGNGRPPDYLGSFDQTFAARYANEGCSNVRRLFSRGTSRDTA